jgi:hypothetical protein
MTASGSRQVEHFRVAGKLENRICVECGHNTFNIAAGAFRVGLLDERSHGFAICHHPASLPETIG